jgi:hypothetical protein
MGLFGDGGASADAKKAEQNEVQRQERIRWGTDQIRKQFDSVFNTPYYQTMEKNARAAWKPQITDQYNQSLKQLQAALSRNGLSDSSIASRKGGDLQYQKGLATQDMRSKIINAINQRKGDVANAENIALSQLANTADPFAAQQQASNLIASNRAEPGYSPLGQLFTDTTAGLATQADLERSNQNRYNMGVTNWFNPKRSVVNVGG